MIELITGLPGNGKTLFTISQVKAQAERENRPVYYHGIPELTLPWEPLDDPKNWASVPPGAIVVIDEAQKTFRNRSLGTQPPPFVTDLETHRHLGIDLVLITQHPSLIDPAVRRLSGRHRHMVRVWGMEVSTVHKWDAVKDNCDKGPARADSEKTKWSFDKAVYKFYKSAEQHTMKRTIPMRAKLLMALPLVLIACGWFVASKVNKAPQVASAATVQGAAQVQAQSTLSPAPGQPVFDPVSDARQYVAMNTPRVEGLPHSAPKYDELTKPTAVPVPSMCIRRGDRCQCYNQRGTKINMGFNECVDIAYNGYFQDFDPEPNKAQEQPPPSPRSVQAPTQSAGVVLALADTGVSLVPESRAPEPEPARQVRRAIPGSVR